MRRNHFIAECARLPGWGRSSHRIRSSALASLFLFVAISIPWTGDALAAGTYYVDASSAACSDAGPGTEVQPYCTISAAVAARGGPGTTIYVKPGTYREQVTIATSGTAGSPLILRALGGPVVVDGADDRSGTGNWVQVSGNVYLAATVTWSPLQVFSDGARLTPSTASPSSLPAGSFRWVSGQGLYVNVGGGSPGTHQLLVGRRLHAFRLSGRSHVTIDGFAATRTEDRGIYSSSSGTGITVINNVVTFANRYGIQVVAGSGHLIASNRSSDHNDHGIGLTGGATGCQVRDNESFRNVNPAEHSANGIYVHGSTGNVVERNRVHDNQDTGLHLGTGANNNVSIQNRSWNNGDHGFDHLSCTGNLDVGNVAYGNLNDGFSIEGSATGTRLYNCIGVNNGVTTGHYDLYVDTTSPSGFLSDYNIFWNSTSATPFKYNGAAYATIAAYRAASGQDANSLQADPRFVNPGAGDLHLMPGSPAIDAANSAVPSWPATDAEGNPRGDDPATSNTGAGPIAYAERGALEFLTTGDLAPVVTAPAAASAAESQPLTVNVTAGDPDGDAISSLTASGLPTGASFTAGPGNTSGTLSWTPAFDQAGSYTVTFTAANALSGAASTVITVGNVDRAPAVTAPAAASATESQPLTVNVTAGDPDGDAIGSLTASELPTGASFTAGPGNTTGTLSWTPGFDQAGSYTVTFTAANALSGATSTVITVSNVDRAPTVTAPATASAAESQPLAVNVTASDPDGDAISSLTASGLPAGASFTAGPGNTTGTFEWTPTAGDAGSYTVTFTAANALSGAASTVITVSNVDRAPVVTAPAAASATESQPLTMNVTAGDPDGDVISSLTASGLPTGASFAAGPGNTSGTLSWTPGFDQGGSYTVTFTAANALSGAASTVITVSNGDLAPVVAAPATAGGPENGPLTVEVTASDPDGDAIASLTASGLPAGASFTAGPGNTTGTLSWTPGFDQAGTYTVTFTAANALSGAASTVITVSNVDRAPVATAPATAAAAESQPLTVNVTASDPDGDAIASLTASGLPAGATFTAGPGNTTGTLSWTPAFDQAGTYTVTFTAANALSGATSTVITVSNVDRAPAVTAPAAASATESQPLTVNVTASDPDGDAIGSLTASGLPAGASFTAGPGNTTGTFEWTPTAGDAGTYTVTFTAANALSGTASTVITVTDGDLPPVVAVPATASAAENQALTVNVTASDPDGDAIASLTASGLPAGASFTAGPGNTTGTLSWTPGFDQAGTYTVTFTAANALSGAASTVITVGNVDRAPAASAPATAGGPENGPLTVEVTASDPDGDAIASLTASGLPAGATFTAGPGNTTGTLSWTPGFDQAGSYTVTFTAANALSGAASTVITVSNVDRAPAVTAPAAASAAEDQPLTVNVTASDPDGDAIGSLTASGLPSGASFTAGPGNTTGTLSWTPGFDQAGTYTVTFTAANALSGAASTVITVSNGDLAPVVAAPATAGGPENGPLTVEVTASDPDGDAIASLTASGLPAGATLTAGPGNTTGTLSWTPAFDQAGSYTVTFTAANALSGAASTVITVSNVDRAPAVTAPAAASAAEDQPLTVNVTASDPDGDAIGSLTASGLPTGASFTAGPGNTTGTLSWTPGFDQAGTYTVTFTAANALSGAASTVITVSNGDLAPVVAAPATAGGPENGPLTVEVTASDPDGDAIASLTASGLPSGASFTAGPGNTTGTLSWTPGFDQAGSYTVTFTAANALSGNASTLITVSNVDRAPAVTAPAAASATESQPLTVNVTASDPDGDAIASLTASGLPAGATFTAGPGNTSGTLNWTPTFDQAGTYTVTFTAANALSGAASTVVTVQNVGQPPVASLTVTPGTGNAPLAVTADASGSVDPDGAIATYRFDFGDGTIVGPQAGPTAAHVYAAGSWTASVTVTDNEGATHTASREIIAAAVPPEPNLVGNPSFEINTAGWGSPSGATLARVTGGFDGAYSLQVSAPSGGGSFEADDVPNWVTSTAAAGATYRFSVWLRAGTGAGSARLKVREYVGTKASGGPKQSNSVTLSATWQLVTLDFVTRNAGSTLDFLINYTPVGANESFLIDNVGIRQLGAGAPGLASAPVEAAPAAGAEDPSPTLGDERMGLVPSPVRTQSTLSFRMATSGSFEVDLLDLAGRRVRRLARAADAPAGVHRLTVDGRGDRGERLPPGVYFYRIRMPGRLEAGRFVIMR